jgi:AcrR family transcriptional regulator
MPQPNPERRSEKSRQATLQAALELCEEQGYAQVTVEGIAARAGVSKKTIYRWWPSKGAVVLEALNEAALRSTAFPDTGDLVADLHSQISGLIDVLTAPRTRTALLGVFTEGLHDPGLADKVHVQLFRARIDQFKDRLRKTQESGEVVADADLDLVMDLLYGPIFHRLMAHLPLPDAAYLSEIIDAALATVRGRAGR